MFGDRKQATIWLFVVSPLPAYFFWPGVLLPSLMASFLAEGSKFLFLDTAICRNTVWYPSGADSLPRIAADCSLGTTGHYSIASGAIFFLSLLLVCLKAPEKRLLDPTFGAEFDRDENDLESAHGYSPSEPCSYTDVSADIHGNVDDRASYDGSHSPHPIVARIGSHHGDSQEVFLSSRSSFADHRRGIFFDKDDAGSEYRDRRNQEEVDDLLIARLKNLDSAEDKYTAKPHEDTDAELADDRYNPTKPAPTTASIPPTTETREEETRISESRVNTIEKMELNTKAESGDMIAKFVSDLDKSFQVDTPHEGITAGGAPADTPTPYNNESCLDTNGKKVEPLSLENLSLCQTLCSPATARSF